MAERQFRSHEAKVDFDEDVLQGEKAQTSNDKNEIFDMKFCKSDVILQ